MALTKCPDCEHAVSTSAPNCPKCGRPMTRFVGKSIQIQRRGGKWEGVGFLLIAAGIVTCFYHGVSGGVLITVGFLIFLVGRFM